MKTTFFTARLDFWTGRKHFFSFILTTAALIMVSSKSINAQLDPRALVPLVKFQECSQCPTMIVMPPGSFMMGAMPGESRNPFDAYGENATFRRRDPNEPNIIPFEHPRHSVEMDIPYAIGLNEVTHAEWMACFDAGGCTHAPDHRVLTPDGYIELGSSHPVINISYLDIQEYLLWLNERVGAKKYRLPTEAEWEYAARAGTSTRFARGDDLTADQANFSRRATENLRGRWAKLPDLVNRWMPVRVQDLDAANGWGLRHMAGNVREITLSCWSDEHLGLLSASAYLAHAHAQASCRRVAKGGAFTTAMDGIRPASRNRPKEDFRDHNLGFRVLRILE